METFLVMSSVLLWVVVGFNLLLTLALVKKLGNSKNVAQSGLGPIGLKAGDKAPDFKAQYLDGEIVSLDSFAGRAVLIIFLSPYCGICREAMPTYMELAMGCKKSDIDFIFVSEDDLVATRALVNEFDVTTPIIFADRKHNTLQQDYQVSGTPAFCIINRQGRIYLVGHPEMEIDHIKQYIQQGGKPNQ